MKRLIISIAFILGLFIVIELSITYWIAIQIEQNFKKLDHHLSDNDLFIFETVEFKKGVLQSEAISQLRLKIKDTPVLLKIKHIIQNGPVVIDFNNNIPVEFLLSKITSSPIHFQAEIHTPFTAITTVNYDREIESNIVGNNYKIKYESFNLIGRTWQAHYSINKNWNKTRGSIQFPENIAQIMGLKVAIAKVASDFSHELVDNGNWIGDIVFEIEKAGQLEMGIGIEKLRFLESSKFKEKVIDISLNIELGRLYYPNKEGSAQINLHLFNINPQALKEFQAVNFNDSIKKQDEAFKSLLLLKPKLIIENTEINLPQGKIKIDADLTMGGADIVLPITKENIEKTMDGNLIVSLPKEILHLGIISGIQQELSKDPEFQKLDDMAKDKNINEQLKLKLKKFIGYGFIIEQDNNYQVKLTMEKGKLMANGGAFKQ